MTRDYSDPSESYLTDTELAKLLGITVARLRNKVSAGAPLPPYIHPAGCRKRLWPCGPVHRWLAGFLREGGLASAGAQGSRADKPLRRSPSPSGHSL